MTLQNPRPPSQDAGVNRCNEMTDLVDELQRPLTSTRATSMGQACGRGNETPVSSIKFLAPAPGSSFPLLPTLGSSPCSPWPWVQCILLAACHLPVPRLLLGGLFRLGHHMPAAASPAPSRHRLVVSRRLFHLKSSCSLSFSGWLEETGHVNSSAELW